MKTRVGVVFGGRSGEHEISLLSAESVMQALSQSGYEVVPIGITRSGRWLTRGNPMDTLRDLADKLALGTLEPPETGQAVTILGPQEMVPSSIGGKVPEVDVLFPVLHGPYGEDGTIQGLLELADIAYVGAGVLGSSLCMDKAALKAVFRAEGLPTPAHIVVRRHEWETGRVAVMKRVAEEIGYPCFVKPANLGSSVGISKVHDLSELGTAMDIAASYDRRLLVEEAINAREIECSIIGNDQPMVSVPGEVVPKREFYDYVAKYLDDSTELIVPARLPEGKAEEIRALAARAFVAVDCAGMARADFFLCRDTGNVYINELNTIPGFTSVSMFPRLWEASGVSYPELVHRLVQLAFERHTERARRSTAKAL